MKLFKKNPKSQEKKEKKGVEYYLLDAIVAFENGDFINAVKHFRALSKVMPEHPLANLMLGRALIELGKYEDAINALFKHLVIVPNSVEALIYLGLTYFECGQPERAMERYEQALQLRQTSLLVRENMAVTLLSSGDPDKALTELYRLHEETPEDPSITELLVIALGRMGKWEIAKNYVSLLNNPTLATDVEQHKI